MQKLPKYALIISVLFLGLVLSGFIAIKLLGLAYTFEPLALFMVLSHQLWVEAGLAIACVFLPLLAATLFYKGGIARIITYYCACLVCIVLACFSVGLVSFQLINHESLIVPWNIVRYMDAISLTPDSYKIFKGIEMGIFFLAAGILFYFAYERLGAPSNALGDAHFAHGLNVKKDGFLTHKDESVIIGKKYGVPLFSNGFEHVLVFAPPGSGKTRSIGIPNLFHFPYSVVCNDVKLTLFETTSGYREKVLGHQCYCWAPAKSDGKTHRFNPLTFISSDKIQRMKDIQRIAHILIPTPKNEAAIWSQASRKLFKAIVLYLLDTPGETVTLGEINRLVKQDNFDEWLQGILNNTEHYSPEFYRNGFSYMNNHDKTRCSIMESFTGYFELFDDPIVDAATSATDFDIRNLRREKMTVYIGFSDDDMERLSPLLTLFWQQAISSMIQEIPDLSTEPYPALCLIDEFSSLGRIERLRRSLKLLREYRVRCVLMFQYIAQTYEQYSHDEARAFTNIKTKIAYSADDIQDAEFISKILGTRTKKVRAGSISHQSRGMSNSKSYNYQAIPLMRPDKIMKMSGDVSLIMRTGSSPIKARQYIWYKQVEMKGLKLPESGVPVQSHAVAPFDHKAKNKRLLKGEEQTDKVSQGDLASALIDIAEV